ncbi:MAG: (Myosin heavy-chain) kinase [Planctomycetaceae bacterium]|nr:(Myosin heavy-chain) kinase [Planctomycetaceae bacterium]
MMVKLLSGVICFVLLSMVTLLAQESTVRPTPKRKPGSFSGPIGESNLPARLRPALRPTLRATLKGHGQRISCVAISRDSKLIVSGCVDGIVKFWDVASAKELRSFEASSNGVTCVAISSDGKLLATGAYGRRDDDPASSSLKLWDLATGKEVASLKGHVVGSSVSSVAFSEDGKTLASGSDDNTAKLWDVATGQVKAGFAHPGTVVLALSRNGKWLATGCASKDDIVRLWDIENRTEIASLKGHSHSVESVAFSSDSKWLASAELLGSVKLWDVAAKKEKATLKLGGTVYRLGFSADGKMLAYSVAKTVNLIDVETSRRLVTIDEAFTDMALSENGRLLVTISADGPGIKFDDWRDLKVWDIPAAQNP